MKKIFKDGDIKLTVKDYKTGVVKVTRGKELIFLGENPTMLLSIHSVLTQLAVELNKDEQKGENRASRRSSSSGQKKSGNVSKKN